MLESERVDYIADRGNSVIAKMIKLGKAMDVIAQGIREHGMCSENLNEYMYDRFYDS